MFEINQSLFIYDIYVVYYLCIFELYYIFYILCMKFSWWEPYWIKIHTYLYKSVFIFKRLVIIHSICYFQACISRLPDGATAGKSLAIEGMLCKLWIPNCLGDKVAQLVRCGTSNQRVARSIPGWGTLVCPWARQFIPYCLSPPSWKMGT